MGNLGNGQGGDPVMELPTPVEIPANVDQTVYVLVLLRTAQGLALGHTDNAQLTFARSDGVNVTSRTNQTGWFELSLTSTAVSSSAPDKTLPTPKPPRQTGDYICGSARGLERSIGSS